VLADLLKEMLELASRRAVHVPSPRNRIKVRSSEYKSARNAVELHFSGAPAAVYFVGAVSGRVTNICSAKTATTAIMAPGTVLCVKFCKGGHGWLESCGLAELNFLVLFEIVHIEIAVGFEPILVGLDG
jgi:hypothetical protein